MKMKEMIYDCRPKLTILFEGKFLGVDFCIVNCGGMHPCAYVRLPDDIVIDGGYEGLDKYAEVHGGFTYGGNDYWHDTPKQKGIWFGWDYAHYGDFSGHYEKLDNEESLYLKKHTHKWTTGEVYADVQQAIFQLKTNLNLK